MQFASNDLAQVDLTEEMTAYVVHKPKRSDECNENAMHYYMNPRSEVREAEGSITTEPSSA